MANTIETDDIKFENDVLKSALPALVLFKSEWCPSCKRLVPVFEAISDNYKDKMIFVKIDAAKNVITSEKNNVLAIPSLILFKAGKEISRNIGSTSEKDLKSIIEKNI